MNSHNVKGNNKIELISKQYHKNTIFLIFNCPMIKLENALLKQTNKMLSLKYGFSNIQVQSLRIRQHEIGSEELLNKQLYLGYVEDVLNRKQHDLIQLDNFLNQRETDLAQAQFQRNIETSINRLQMVRRNEKLIEQLSNRFGIKNQEFALLKKQIEGDCFNERLDMEQAVKEEFDNLIDERKTLRKKINQYAQLSSYEKYLNELHDALEQKQQEIQEKQKTMRFNSYSSFKPHTEESFKSNDYRSSVSQKRKTRIFQNKTFSSPNKVNYAEEHATFGQKQRKLPEINESSEIMREDSKQIQNILQKSQEKQNRQKQCENICVQANIQNINETQKRLKQEKLKLKFVKKWIGKKLEDDGISNKKRRILTLYKWKLNACFDEDISKDFKKNMAIMDRNWMKKTKLLKEQQLFPYNKLSIQRKNYLQYTFDHQRKVLHRKSIENSLKSIIKNKIRKERLVFYYYFFRFFKNTITRLPQSSQNETHSRYIYSTSSHILTEDKATDFHNMNKNNKKSRSPALSKSLKKSFNKATAKQKQMNKSEIIKQDLSKQNEVAIKKKRNTSSDVNEEKLKEYISEKQRIEKVLATQCVKMQGLNKMIQILMPVSFRVTNDAMMSIKEEITDLRMDKLQTTINSMEFKIDLFITKCRLGVANNSNKLSTIENLLGLTNR